VWEKKIWNASGEKPGKPNVCQSLPLKPTNLKVVGIKKAAMPTTMSCEESRDTPSGLEM
jgi:hypothetical protein